MGPHPLFNLVEAFTLTENVKNIICLHLDMPQTTGKCHLPAPHRDDENPGLFAQFKGSRGLAIEGALDSTTKLSNLRSSKWS